MDTYKKYQSVIYEERKRITASRTEKYCRHCDTVKPIADFYPPSLSGLTGTSCWCKSCLCQYARDRRKERRIRRELDKFNHR